MREGRGGEGRGRMHIVDYKFRSLIEDNNIIFVVVGITWLYVSILSSMILIRDKCKFYEDIRS